ncbi:MAG: hypothetical protein ACPLPT_05550 [Moorellales bacterium]
MDNASILPRLETATAESAWPDPLEEEAYHGLAGDIVRAIEPHSEADPVALLSQFLVGFGNVVGHGPNFTVEADRHALNLFVALVGTTSKGRKGTAWGHVYRLLKAVDPEWAGERVKGGLSSGEGLIWAVRDPIWAREPIKKGGRVEGYQDVMVDAGIADKRLLVYETEFASVLKVLTREGNTLSAQIRQAWDTGDLRVLTKNNPAAATGAHISIVAHITKAELLRNLTATEAANGFANRFIWLCVKRSKTLPDGGRIQEVDFAPLVARLKEAVAFARTVGEMRRDEEASAVWHEVYGPLSEGKPGLLGEVIGRAEAQVMRLACVYALLDLSETVRREHLEAALALWDYAEASARFIFGHSLGDPVADRILEVLGKAPEGMTRTGLLAALGRHVASARLSSALETLIDANRVRVCREKGSGRPAERYYLVS